MDDESAIRETVKTYVLGMTYGDRDDLLRAFHTRAVSAGHFEGALEWEDVEAFAVACEREALARGEPVPPWEIETLHVSGDTAVAIVTNVWAGLRFRDILTLLKEGGAWRIVFKCFHHLA